MIHRLLACALVAASCTHGAPLAKPGSVVATLAKDARAAAPVCTTPWVRRFLDRAGALPAVQPFAIELDGKRRLVDEEQYYVARYGTPVAYCRTLEVAGLDDIAHRRVLDYGYGAIGQLRMLAALGADVTGVDVDPLLAKMYQHDRGAFGAGRLTLLSGFFPRDQALRAQVGTGYQLIVARNVLKEGYVHPRQRDPRYDSGVDDTTLLRAFFEALAPGGRMVIYNLSPAANQPDKPYRAWADAPLPFSRALLEQLGFRVLVYDQDDSATARQLARALGWDHDDPPMDVEHDLFARFTVLERP